MARGARRPPFQQRSLACMRSSTRKHAHTQTCVHTSHAHAQVCGAHGDRGEDLCAPPATSHPPCSGGGERAGEALPSPARASPAAVAATPPRRLLLLPLLPLLLLLRPPPLAGNQRVCHLACPPPTAPALCRQTANVLGAVNRAPGVRRVVMTSSAAAVFNTTRPQGYVFTGEREGMGDGGGDLGLGASATATSCSRTCFSHTAPPAGACLGPCWCPPWLLPSLAPPHCTRVARTMHPLCRGGLEHGV